MLPILLLVLLAGCPKDAPPAEAEAGPGTAPLGPTPPPAAGPVAQEAASEPAGAAPAAAEIQAARRLIGRMVAAYRDAPALTDRIVMQSRIGGRNQAPIESSMSLGPGTELAIHSPSNEVVCRDQSLYFTHHAVPDRYLEVPLVEDALTTLTAVFGAYSGVMAQCALRYEKPFDELVQALSFGLPDRARISGYRSITDEQGRRLEQVSLISATGSTAVNVDPDTALIVAVDYQQKPGGPVKNFTIARHFELEPRVLAALPEPIAFDPGDRVVVETPGELFGKADEKLLARLALAPGEPAPDFTMHTLAGSRVELSGLKGSVVVMTFWASWNQDSRLGLPGLRPIAQWAESGSLPVRFLPVNGLRRLTPAEQNWKAATSYWEKEGFEFASLIDPQDELFRAWGVLGVPTTIVLDQAGRFVRAWAGLDEEVASSVQATISGLLNDSG